MGKKRNSFLITTHQKVLKQQTNADGYKTITIVNNKNKKTNKYETDDINVD